jgi:hypothetical protein
MGNAWRCFCIQDGIQTDASGLIEDAWHNLAVRVDLHRQVHERLLDLSGWQNLTFDTVSGSRKHHDSF